MIGRLIQNGRVLRQEIKTCNVRDDRLEDAWTAVEVGLLADRYAKLFAHSISTASFYTEQMGIDDHDDSKVIDLYDLRQEYINDYRGREVNMKTHPIMRRFCDIQFCDENRYHQNWDQRE